MDFIHPDRVDAEGISPELLQDVIRSSKPVMQKGFRDYFNTRHLDPKQPLEKGLTIGWEGNVEGMALRGFMNAHGAIDEKGRHQLTAYIWDRDSYHYEVGTVSFAIRQCGFTPT